MKRPVTSLCRRPGKKDRLRGSLSPVREQFPPIETLCEGQAELPGKSRPNEGSKTVPGEAGGCVQTAPMWEWRTWGFWCRESTALGCPPGQRAYPAQKQSPARAGDCVQAAPMGEWRAMGVSGSGKAPHWAHAGTGGTPGRKNSPRRGPEAVWMRDMGVTCPGRSV